MAVGDEVVLAYVEGDGIETPLRQLFGFQRVSLSPGEGVEIFFSNSPVNFAVVIEEGDRIIRAGPRNVMAFRITKYIQLTTVFPFLQVIISNGLVELKRQVVIKNEKFLRRHKRG